MNHPLAAPAGTSGWFLGSMGQWDLFIREFCEITEEAEEIHETDPKNMDFAASIPVSGGIRSLGTHFVSAGYDDPFADPYDDYGFWTSTEVNTLFAWGIFFNTGEDEDSDGDEECCRLIEFPDEGVVVFCLLVLEVLAGTEDLALLDRRVMGDVPAFKVFPIEMIRVVLAFVLGVGHVLLFSFLPGLEAAQAGRCFRDAGIPGDKDLAAGVAHRIPHHTTGIEVGPGAKLEDGGKDGVLVADAVDQMAFGIGDIVDREDVHHVAERDFLARDGSEFAGAVHTEEVVPGLMVACLVVDGSQ